MNPGHMADHIPIRCKKDIENSIDN